MARAREVIPRGLNSNARNRHQPLAFSHAEGAHLFDLDGRRLLDVMSGLGPVILGHRFPAVRDAVVAQVDRLVLPAGQTEEEVALAERLVDWIPCAEKVLFSTSGTESVQIAIRLARASTGRQLIVKFQGHYHGWVDSVFSNTEAPAPGAAGPVFATTSTNAGSIISTDLLVLPWDDVEAIRAAFDSHSESIAGVILEPIPGRTTVAPSPGFLEELRRLCTMHGSLLIFDEVITGFRVSASGAQGLFGIVPDLATFAKAVANGHPLSFVAGSEMAMAPAVDGRTRHMGTYNANPVGLAASLAVTTEIGRQGKAFYAHLSSIADRIVTGVEEAVVRHHVPVTIQRCESLMTLEWDGPPLGGMDPDDQITVLCEGMALEGAYVDPRGNLLINAAYTDDDADHFTDGLVRVWQRLRRNEE